MKNWLIEKLGGVSKKDYEEVIQTAERLRSTAKDYSQRISDGLKEKAEMRAEKAEMEKAAEMVSANLSETISSLNEEKRTSNGLMAKMTAQTQKIEELQAEIEAKNAELARVKSEIIAISKIKADTTLKTENQRLRAEVELLKRNKFKRGRK
nr:MAG TPA: Intraflagellar transport complex B, subunit 20 [Caudoviricetes sp.]